MQPYQEQYVQNAREIAALCSFYSSASSGFEAWYEAQRQGQARIRALRADNLALLNGRLFPELDELHSAGEEAIASLEAFADQLMDWKANLDCGVYVIIHDALLRLYRVRRDRNRVIKELYKLGMGLYYQRRSLAGIGDPKVKALLFQNEMAFTEAASYMRYYDEIDDEETRGYIIRSVANVALCVEDPRRKIAVSARTLQILRDEHCRALAPGLPWESFVRRTHQQMSANRTVFSRGNLTREELAEVLDSCYEVFKPEEGVANPSVRWLWPYYEMEYSCGYVDLKTTLDRLEELINRTPYDQYDVSGLYANIQLVSYYGRLMRNLPALREEPARVRFLGEAYEKMQRTLLTCPPERFDDYFFYMLDVVFSNFYEMEGLLSYRALTTRLMQRFSGELYVRSRRAGDLMRCCCAALYEQDPGFFDDIPFLRAIEDPGEKRRTLLDYAAACGLYHDFGLIKMNIGRTEQTRSLFEDEYQMYQLHAVAGRDDLKARASTAVFADIAFGHHSWYDGSGGYPEGYVRLASPYRQMTDVAAMVSCLLEYDPGDPAAAIRGVIAREGRQLSPMVTACLNDEAVAAQVAALLADDGRAYYQSIYQELIAGKGGAND